MGNAKRRKDSGVYPDITVLKKSYKPLTELEWDRAGIRVKQRTQSKSLRSLSEDMSPESSQNWLIGSDGEDLFMTGTLDECLEASSIQQDCIKRKIKNLCLAQGCSWFFHYDWDLIRIALDAIEAAKFPEGCNFLTLQHQFNESQNV